MLHARGVPTDFVAVGEETRTNIVVTEPDGRQHVKVNEPGPTVAAAEQEQLLARVATQAQPGDIWVLAGSLPRGVADEFYARLIEQVQAGGARAVLDASGPALVAGLRARPFLAKPNALEAEQATGLHVRTPQDAAQAAAHLHGQADLVAISLGADGMVASDGMQTIHAQPPAITARNTVGAGDATVAGLLYALAQGLAWPEVVRWAVACGTAAAMRPGVDFAPLAGVEQVTRRVQVAPL
jgi:1-phosphofructokinase family hexose kinase